MSFSSSVFILLFFPIFFAIYYVVCRSIKWKNLWTLFASLVFYAFGGLQYLLLILISILANYYIGILIDRNEERKRKIIVGAGIIFNLLLLGVFKYFNFFVSNIVNLINYFGFNITDSVPNIPIPIGISFYTFQILSYLIDLYKKRIKVQKSIANFALYILMFPQLIVGPIVRYSTVEQQLQERKTEKESIRLGVIRFVLGLTKKMIIANAMCEIADWSYLNISVNNILIAWIGAVAYSLQIYFDFSGYSDMAIGMGKMLGFHYLENFDFPYTSKSIKEFWRKWHISLSSWFRDYVYIPLGGNRKSTGRTYINLSIVFLLTGFWHGAAWNFIFWGIYHGLFLILERIKLGEGLAKIPSVFQHIYAMIIVIIGWIFFRAQSLNEAFTYLRNMLCGRLEENWRFIVFWDNRMTLLMIAAVFFAICPRVEKFLLTGLTEKRKAVHVAVDCGAVIMWLVCICFLTGTSFNPFIYFKF